MGVIIALISACVTFLALVVSIVKWSVETRDFGRTTKDSLDHLRVEVKDVARAIRRMPYVELRVALIEKHLELSMPSLNDIDGHDS